MSQKKVLILGATGGTGQHLVSQASTAGHEVTALVRTPDRISVHHDRLRVIAGSVEDVAALAEAVRGQDAVISALGRGQSLKANGLIARSVPAILSAMRTNGVRRLIFTSAVGVGENLQYSPLFSRIMARTLLKDLYADKIIGEDLIRRSDVDWTIAQPAQLTNGPLTRRYRAGERLALSGMPKISRADLADFLIGQLDDATNIRRVVVLAY